MDSPARRARLRTGVIAVSAVLSTAPASADVSSWLFVGAGPSVRWDETRERTVQPSLQIDTGLGTDPSGGVIFGGLFRVQPHFGFTTDLALLARGASHGFVNGDWGLALDLGGYQRVTEDERGLVGSLVFGAPWGITFSATGSTGFDDRYLASAVLGVDLARLTVYRTTGKQWWHNPFPAYRPGE